MANVYVEERQCVRVAIPLRREVDLAPYDAHACVADVLTTLYGHHPGYCFDVLGVSADGRAWVFTGSWLGEHTGEEAEVVRQIEQQLAPGYWDSHPDPAVPARG